MLDIVRGLRVAALLLSAVVIAGAQQSTGTISGIVTDQQGAVVPGAQVEVLNTATNALFATSSNESGLYVAPGMVVGEYEIAVEAEGFRRSVRSGRTLLERPFGNGLLREPLESRTGRAIVPERPGIGAEFDESVLERYRVA